MPSQPGWQPSIAASPRLPHQDHTEVDCATVSREQTLSPDPSLLGRRPHLAAGPVDCLWQPYYHRQSGLLASSLSWPFPADSFPPLNILRRLQPFGARKFPSQPPVNFPVMTLLAPPARPLTLTPMSQSNQCRRRTLLVDSKLLCPTSLHVKRLLPVRWCFPASGRPPSCRRVAVVRHTSLYHRQCRLSSLTPASTPLSAPAPAPAVYIVRSANGLTPLKSHTICSKLVGLAAQVIVATHLQSSCSFPDS